MFSMDVRGITPDAFFNSFPESLEFISPSNSQPFIKEEPSNVDLDMKYKMRTLRHIFPMKFIQSIIFHVNELEKTLTEDTQKTLKNNLILDLHKIYKFFYDVNSDIEANFDKYMKDGATKIHNFCNELLNIVPTFSDYYKVLYNELSNFSSSEAWKDKCRLNTPMETELEEIEMCQLVDFKKDLIEKFQDLPEPFPKPTEAWLNDINQKVKEKEAEVKNYETPRVSL